MKAPFKSSASSVVRPNLAALEPIIDQLLSGVANAQEVAERLQALGQPIVLDPTEQLRLALRLLECHDDSVGTSKKRPKPPRLPEADLA
ncbi:hypothetical protein BH10BDE1_BH10BDE1_21000 [soil metagenome]